MLFSGRKLTSVRGGRTVFADVEFSVAAGHALVLRGPNGSGKSTLLRLAAGFLQPTEGTLEWDGTPVAADLDGHRARVAYVGHVDAVKSALTVAENLGFWVTLSGGSGADTKAALAALGLAELADAPAAYLSAGQRRRLNLARLAASRAPLWLLDEPTVSLDAPSVAALVQIVAEHCAGGGQAIIATHDRLDLPAVDTLTFVP